MGIKILSYVPAILGVLSIAFFVLQNNPKNIKNRVFFLTNVLISLWLVFLFLADLSTNESAALWFLRFGLAFGQLMLLVFYYFSLVFPYYVKTRPIKQIFFSIPMLVTSVLLLTPLGVESVNIQDFGVQPESTGFIYTFSDLLGLFYLIVGIVILLKKYKKSDLRQKNQIKFMLLGLFTAGVINILTGFVLTLMKIESDFLLFGSFSLFIFSLFVAYAIIKHGFFDIRLLVARSAAYVLLLLTATVSFASFVIIVPAGIIGSQKPSSSIQIYYTVAAIVLAFGFQPLKKFFNRITSRLFYQDAYDPQMFLDELNKTLVSTIELQRLLLSTTEVLEKNMKAGFCAFSIRDSMYAPHQQTLGGRIIDKDTQAEIDQIIQSVDDKVFVAAYMEDSDKSLKNVLERIKVAVLVRLSLPSKNKVDNIGFLLLGAKKSGNPYSSQDIRVLEIIANELVIAVQNALRFEEIQKFNITLQEEVKRQTGQLREANKRLRLLDQTKDDFISMASHQMRTPLTSVKGYLSMVLEGDAGKLNDKEKKLLNQAFISSQRMVYLISDLLNVSRLKTGKFVIDNTETNLAEAIAGEVEQLKETAEARNLKLNYQKPENFPTLTLDDTKMRQVLMNFMDNAIHYTPSGGKIDVVLKDTGQAIEFTVTDNGIGVPKAEQHNLFSKFFRAGNAKKARPDGTGLGLYMAQKVIIAQGGSVIFRSEEGKGSTFGFSIAKSKLQSSDAKKQEKSQTS